MKKYINDLLVNEKLELIVGVTAVSQLIPYKTGKSGMFVTLQLSDRTGSMVARIFGNESVGADVTEYIKNVEKGKIFAFHGVVNEYNGNLQFLIDVKKPCIEVIDFIRDDFLPSIDLDIEAEFERIFTRCNSIKNENLQKLLLLFLKDENLINLYKNSPAAMKRHHAHLGGLMKHTNEMIQIADLLCDMYSDIDRDVLITGCILHDFGKIFELESVLTFYYSDMGKLVGHPVILIELLHDKISLIEKFPKILENQILHMIISHHGQLAEIKPKTLEAVALHHIDNLDAQVNFVNNLLIKNIDQKWVTGSNWNEEYFNTLQVNEDEIIPNL